MSCKNLRLVTLPQKLPRKRRQPRPLWRRATRRRLRAEPLENRYLLTAVAEAVDDVDLAAESAIVGETLEAEIAIEAYADAAAAADVAVPMLLAVADEAPATDAELAVKAVFLESDAVAVSADGLDNGATVETVEFVMVTLGADSEVATWDGAVDTQKDSPVLLETITKDVSADDDIDVPVRIYLMSADDGSQEPLGDGTDEGEIYTMGGPDVLRGSVDIDEPLSTEDPTVEILLLSATSPSPWQNQDDPLDVNADGLTTATDALLIINQVNAGTPLTARSAAQVSLFVDVTGDRRVNPLDAIQVINALNEATAAPTAPSDTSRVAPIWYGDLPNDAFDRDEPEPLVEPASEEVSDEFEPMRMPAFMTRPADDTDRWDVDSLADEKPLPDELDAEVFTADADWLLPDLA